MTGAPAAVHVVCLGNPWHGDDGFGRHVYRRLRQRDDLPPAVELFDAGIAGLDVLPLLDGCAKAVIVDAVRVGAPVGTLHRLVPSDLEPPGGELSLHELGLSSLLAALRGGLQPPARSRRDRRAGRQRAGVHRSAQRTAPERSAGRRRDGRARMLVGRDLTARDSMCTLGGRHRADRAA